MNPLDKEELKAFFKIIKNDMPLHTDNSMKIKMSYDMGFPKDIKEHSVKINNKFLNNNLHIIEEMEYRKKGITCDFKNYQNKHYDESGILNHDLYFKHDDKIYAKVSGGSFFNQNALSFSNASLNRIASSAELETTSTDDNNISLASNGIDLYFVTGVIGTVYNQLAVKMIGTTGNVKIGCYADNGSSAPSTLLADSGSNASATGYTYRTVTEFTLTTAKTWLAVLFSNLNDGVDARVAANTKNYKVLGSFNLPSPINVSTYADDANIPRMKMRYL